MGITRTGIRPRENFRVKYQPPEIPSLVGTAAKSIPAHLDMIDDSRLPFKVAKGVLAGSLLNGRRVAQEVNERGRKLGIPTEPEWEKLNELLGDQLEGTNYVIWTETEHEDYPGQFVRRHQGYDGVRLYDHPDNNYSGNGVRFIEKR